MKANAHDFKLGYDFLKKYYQNQDLKQLSDWTINEIIQIHTISSWILKLPYLVNIKLINGY